MYIRIIFLAILTTHAIAVSGMTSRYTRCLENFKSGVSYLKSRLYREQERKELDKELILLTLLTNDKSYFTPKPAIENDWEVTIWNNFLIQAALSMKKEDPETIEVPLRFKDISYKLIIHNPHIFLPTPGLIKLTLKNLTHSEHKETLFNPTNNEWSFGRWIWFFN